jgi:hypothetical protein
MVKKSAYAKYIYNAQVKENERSGACSTHGMEEKFIPDFGGKARKKEENLD